MRTNNGVAIPNSWDQYSTQIDGPFELAHSPIWDTITFTDNSTIRANFFDTARANDGLGNATFPLQNSFLVKALGFFFKNQITTDDAGSAAVFASSFGDVQLVINTGVLSFNVGKKDWGPFPMWRLAAGGGAWGVIAAAGAEAANLVHDSGQLGSPQADNIYKLAIPFVIPAQTQARCQLNWAAAVNLTGDATICLILEGIEARPIQ
jgi:hypothetical protein